MKSYFELRENLQEIARSMTPMKDKFGKSKAEKEAENMPDMCTRNQKMRMQKYRTKCRNANDAAATAATAHSYRLITHVASHSPVQ